jgi:hypothetical protein
VLDLWFTKVVKTHLEGEAYLVRYIDDFVICFQYRSDAVNAGQNPQKDDEDIHRRIPVYFTQQKKGLI